MRSSFTHHEQKEGSWHASYFDGEHGGSIVTELILVKAHVVVEQNSFFHFEFFQVDSVFGLFDQRNELFPR